MNVEDYKQYNKSNYLSYLELIQLAIAKIGSIFSVDELKQHLEAKATDITDQRLKTEAFIWPASEKFLGQKTYYFVFTENRTFWGEFNVDFIPIDSTSFMRNAIQELVGTDSIKGRDRRELVNFRIQLFAEGIFPSSKINKKHNEIFKLLIDKYGSSNDSDLTKQWNFITKQETGENINFWNTQINNCDYSISFYKLKKKFGVRPSISFAISKIL